MVFNPKKVEWWIHIGPENYHPTPDDIQVGAHKLDRALPIYGEPRTWWDKRIKEPQARYVMTELWRHEASLRFDQQRHRKIAPKRCTHGLDNGSTPSGAHHRPAETGKTVALVLSPPKTKSHLPHRRAHPLPCRR